MGLHALALAPAALCGPGSVALGRRVSGQASHPGFSTVLRAAPREAPAGLPRQRRGALGLVAAVAASVLGGVCPARAEDAAAKTAVFSAGDARFVQAFFEGIRYKGLVNIEVGRMAGDGTRAVRVTYDPKRCSYKALLGAYWRHIDPTDGGGQFGDRGAEFRPVIWVADETERKLAEKSRKLMEGSAVFGPPVTKDGKLIGGEIGTREAPPFNTEFADLGVFEPRPEDGQDFSKLKPDEYQKLFERTGRAKYFKEHFEPVATTACKDGVCGYVYFPCTEQNNCTTVANGTFSDPV